MVPRSNHATPRRFFSEICKSPTQPRSHFEFPPRKTTQILFYPENHAATTQIFFYPQNHAVTTQIFVYPQNHAATTQIFDLYIHFVKVKFEILGTLFTVDRILKLKNCTAGKIFAIYDVACLKMHTGDSLRVIEILNLVAKKLRSRQNFCVS